MTEEWRLLLTGDNTAFTNMAIDEAVLMKCTTRGTLRLYKWSPRAVSIGYFQGMEDEVDVAKCRQAGIDVIRRLTGGGAVYHDSEITYSLIVSEDSKKIPRNIMDSYSLICKSLVLALKQFGVKAEFKPINDVLVGSKKISGSAQTRRHGGVLQHGTLLYDVNVPQMFELLRVPNEKIKHKLIKTVEERVTSIKHEIGEVGAEELTAALISGFEAALDVRLVPGELTLEEIKLAEQMRRDKYEREEWNFKR